MDKWLSRAGITASIIYLIFLGFIVKDRWPEFLSLGLNEQGDFLAGVFGPLAFLWLVLGFFQQRIELKQNTEALQLQATEIRNSVEQQEELVKVTREQFKVELDAIQHDRAQQLRIYQPIFSLIEAKLIEQGYVYIFKNIGASATDLHFSIDQENIKVFPDRVYSSEKGQNLTIDIRMPEGVSTLDTRLTINYNDFLNHPGDAEYDLFVELDDFGFLQPLAKRLV